MATWPKAALWCLAPRAHAREIGCSGDEIIAGSNEFYRVIDLVQIEEEDSPFVGLLQVEAA